MGFKEISVEEATAQLESGDATFIDVRDGGSWRSGHIPGAQSVGDHNISEFIATADKTRTVVVYCYHGNSSRGGAAYLAENGFADVYSMSGGMSAWSGPTERAESAPHKAPQSESRAPTVNVQSRPAAPTEFRPSAPDLTPESGGRSKRDRIKARLQRAVDDAKALLELI